MPKSSLLNLFVNTVYSVPVYVALFLFYCSGPKMETVFSH